VYEGIREIIVHLAGKWCTMEKITAEKIKERIKENLSRAKSNSTPIMISNAEPTQKKNNGDLLKYLLSLKDNDVFLREAYGKILGRMPDGHGYKHYMDELNEGVPQKAILYRLINSPEARAKKVEIKFRPELTFYAFISRLRPIIKKVPLASTIFFWLYRLLRLPSRFHQLSQHFKVVLSEVGGLQAQESSHSSAIEGLQSQFNSLSSFIKTLQSQNSSIFLTIRELKDRESSLSAAAETLQSQNSSIFAAIREVEAQERSRSSVIEGLQSQLASLSSAGGKRISSDWAKFYSREITNEDMAKNVEHHRYFIDLVSEWANKASNTRIPKILEIGIGTATMSIYLSKRYFEVVGLDLDPLIVAKAIETNNKLGGHAKFVAMDAFDLSKFFKENAFDIAFSQGTLEHFDNEKLKQILEAQLPIAKCVILSVPSVNWQQEDFGDERKMTVEEWKKLLNDFELKIEHISYYQEGDLHIAIVISKPRTQG
jgi:chaperonin cofactor prefoldin